MKHLAIQILVFLLSPLAFASPNGPLPKGGRPVAQPAEKKAPVPEDNTIICHKYLANIFGDEMFFIGTDQVAALLKIKTEGKTASTGQGRYNVVAIKYSTRSSQTLAALTLKKASLLLPHGKDLDGLSVITFQQDWQGCHEGLASAVSIGLKTSKKVHRMLPLKEYALVPSDNGVLAADLKMGSLWIVDVKNFQKRLVRSYPKTEFPLYQDVAGKKFYTLIRKDRGTLLRYHLDTMKKEAELRLKEGWRLLQSSGSFGVVSLDKAKNEVLLQTLSGWTGKEANASFRIAVPREYPVDEATFSVDFPNRRLLIYSKLPKLNRQWDKVFLYDFNKGSLINSYQLPPQTYLAQGKLAPDGQSAALLIKHRLDHSLNSLMLLNAKSNRWEPAHLLLKP